jgi:hypothetical protein
VCKPGEDALDVVGVGFDHGEEDVDDVVESEDVVDSEDLLFDHPLELAQAVTDLIRKFAGFVTAKGRAGTT